MRTRALGSSDLAVSVVGLGCNQLGTRVDEAGTRAIVDAALDAGITFFDTAESYGGGRSEELLGRALAGRRDRARDRDEVRLGPGASAGSREYVRGAIEGSLRRLGTDRIDLYQYHRPDGVTPIEETLGALSELVAEGKVRFVGSSQLSGAQVAEADEVARARGLDAVRLGAEPVLAPRARGRARPRPGVRAARDRRDPVLPARARAADGQVPPRRAGAGRGRASRRRASTSTPRCGTGSTRSRRSRARGA